METEKGMSRISYNNKEWILLFANSAVALVLIALGIRGEMSTIIAGVIVGAILPIYAILKFLFASRTDGLVAKFANLHEAKEDMKQEFIKAKLSKFFLQIGRAEFSGKPSFFYELANEKSGTDDEILILHASANSPELSETKAKKLKKNHRVWMTNLHQIKAHLALLMEQGAKITVRDHQEPFHFRVFIMDDIAYVSNYQYLTQNDRKSVVYKFKNGSNSLYKVFNNYFDQLWEKYNKPV